MRNIMLYAVSTLLLSVILLGCNSVTYNNTSPKDKLLTMTYPESICRQIQHRITYDGLHMNDLKKMVKLQCVRKTETGSYAVLKLENQQYAYIVIDEDNTCTAIHQFREPFQTRDDIEAILKNSVCEREVRAYNLNTVYMIISNATVEVAFYPVQEGFIVAQYWKLSPSAEDYILQKLEFYEDIVKSPYAGESPICPILDLDRRHGG